MLLKRRACLLVCGVIRRDIGKRHAAQLGGEALTERDNLHGEPPLLLCLPDFPSKSASWQGSQANGDRAKMKFSAIRKMTVMGNGDVLSHVQQYAGGAEEGAGDHQSGGPVDRIAVDRA